MNSMSKLVLDYETPVIRSGRSRAGFTSVLLGVAGIVSTFGFFVTWVVVGKTRSGQSVYEPGMISLICLASALLCFLSGLTCGIVGVVQKKRKQGWAKTGLAINACGLLAGFALLA